MRAIARFIAGILGPQVMLAPDTGTSADTGATPTSLTTDTGATPDKSDITLADRGGSSGGIRYHKSDGHGFCDPEPIDATGDGIPRCEQFSPLDT